jgi:DNA-binding transcriptional regulator YiaG
METMTLQEQIKKAIESAGGITAAARALGMPRKTLEEWRDRSEWPDNYKTAMVKSFLNNALLHPDGRLMTGN